MKSSPPIKPDKNQTDFMSQGLYLLEALASKQAAQILVAMGLLCSLVSAWPLMETLTGWGSSAWALVLLLYSMGLWGGSYPLQHEFRSVSQFMRCLSVVSIPLNYLALAALDLNFWPNKILGLSSLILLPLMAWSLLPILLNHRRDPIYIVCLSSLGMFSSFLPNLISPLMRQGLSHLHYSLLVQLLSGAVLSWGIYRISKQIWCLPSASNDSKNNNLRESILLIGLLLGSWTCGISLYPLSTDTYLISMAWVLLLFLGVGLKLRHIQSLYTHEYLPRYWQVSIMFCELSAALLSIWMSWNYALTGFSSLASQSFEGVHPLSCLLSSLALWYLTAIWYSDLKSESSLIGPFLSGALSVYFVYSACFQLLGVQHIARNYEAGALLFALISWLMMTLTHVKILAPTRGIKVWQIGCQALGLMTMICSWYQIAQFKDWSLMTTASLLCLSLAGIYWARFCLYSAIGYLSILTALIAILSTVIQFQPLLSLDSWRWLILGLAFVMVICAWTIERLSPGGQIQQLFKASAHSLFKRHLPDPYRFRERYISHIPYLFAEPLYNLAMILVTGAWLSNLGDLSFCLSFALFYALVFTIYPSRLWLYMILLSLSDGLIQSSQNVLPIKYHSWGLIMISSGWFCMGMLLEELLEARDRQNPHSEYENQKKWVKPFFHMALAANGLMLHKVFGQVQAGAAQENWQILANQALPMTVTACLYFLKMRVYVSKLWFYPGMLSMSFGLYFGLGQFLPLEGLLLVFTLMAWIWWAVATSWRQSSALQSWWQNLVSHRVNAKQFSTAYQQIHLQNPHAPFEVMASICAGLSLVISLLVLPAQLGDWQSFVPISFLTKSHTSWIQGFQILNFVLLALFYGCALPVQALFQRQFYDALVLLCGSHVLLWVLREQIELSHLSLILVSLAALWQIILTLGQRGLSQYRQSLLSHSVTLLTGLGILCEIGLVFDFPWYISTNTHIHVLTLAVLTAVIVMQIQYRPQIWQYHVLGPLMGINLPWMNSIFNSHWFFRTIPHSIHQSIVMISAPLVLLILWQKLRTRPDVSENHGKHLHAWTLTYLLIYSLFSMTVWHTHQPEFVWMLTGCLGVFGYFVYQLKSWRWLWPLAALAYVFLFVQAQAILNLVALIACLPLLIWSTRQLESHAKANLYDTSATKREVLKSYLNWTHSSHVTILSSPIVLLIPLLRLEETSQAGLLAWQIPGFLIALSVYAYHFLFHARHRQWLWWPISLLANLCWEWIWWKGLLQDMSSDAVGLSSQVHISLLLPAVTCLLLGHYVIQKQAEKDQMTYLALSLFLLMPLSLLLIRTTGLPKQWLLAEILTQALLMVLLANVWRRRALLYMGVGMSLCVTVALIGALLLYGDAWVRWSIFMGLGLTLALTGFFLQQRREWLHWLIGHWKHSLVEWR